MALTQVWTAGERVTAAKLNTDSIPIVSSTTDITTPYTSQIIYNSSVPGLQIWNGASWALFSPNVRHIPKTTLQSVTSNTTLQNDTAFAFSVVANSTHELESFLKIDGAADPAGGLKMSFTGPAGAVLDWAAYGANQGALTSYDVVAQSLGGAGRVMGTNGGTAMTCRPAGNLVVAGTAGTLQFQWAQGTSNATSTRILAGSWMRLTRIT